MYHRRYNILSSLCSPQEAKKMLKNQVELLQTNAENLFRKEFTNNLTESIKSTKNLKENFLKLDDSKKPFRSGSLIEQQQCNSEGQEQISTDDRGNQGKKLGAGAGKARVFKVVAGDFKVKTSTQLFLDIYQPIPKVELVNVHTLIKRLISKETVNKSSRHSSSWRNAGWV